jgi:hypothetical protein
MKVTVGVAVMVALPKKWARRIFPGLSTDAGIVRVPIVVEIPVRSVENERLEITEPALKPCHMTPPACVGMPADRKPNVFRALSYQRSPAFGEPGAKMGV